LAKVVKRGVLVVVFDIDDDSRKREQHLDAF
jgi:hypothetical protein